MKSGCRSCALGAASSSALGKSRPKITHTSTSIWAMPVRSSAHIALRYSVSVRAWVHTKLIRQIVLTVIWTELKRKAAAPLLSLCCPQPTSARRHRPAVSGGTMATNDPSSAECKRHNGRTRGCARPSHRSRPGSSVERPISTASAEARAAQRGFGFYIGLAVRNER
jgi:hypothetical protein